MAEVYVIGQICSANNFREPNLFIRWNFQAGKYSLCLKEKFHNFDKILGSLWKVIEGDTEGQTATNSNLEEKSIFQHPIDLHYAIRGIAGWPKLTVEVLSVNSLKQFYPVGVGFQYLPNTPGTHRVKISLWRITSSSLLDSIKEKFFTGGFTIIKKDLINSGTERYKLSTISSGYVEVELAVVFKDFRKYNINFD